jgi:tRNA(Leu) C34 or U34 (ribose-2'-O)-methylase TrmL
MMQDVHVIENPGFPWQQQHSTRRILFFHQAIGLQIMEEMSQMLRLEHNFSRC